jgi:hypothetical protein
MTFEHRARLVSIRTSVNNSAVEADDLRLVQEGLVAAAEKLRPQKMEYAQIDV